MDLFEQPAQNYFVNVVDETMTGHPHSNPDSMSIISSHESKKTRTKKQRIPRPHSLPNGPTNREQFQQLFNMVSELQNKINHLEQENTTLKAMIALSQLMPGYANNSIDNSVLPELFKEKYEMFIRCMK